MKTLVAIAAAIEIPTGLMLIFAPSMFMRLLFGAHMSGPDEALGPLAGFALFALAIACWPSRRAAAPAPSAVLALLVFSLLCAVYLTYHASTELRLAAFYGRLPQVTAWSGYFLFGVGSQQRPSIDREWRSSSDVKS